MVPLTRAALLGIAALLFTPSPCLAGDGTAACARDISALPQQSLTDAKQRQVRKDISFAKESRCLEPDGQRQTAALLIRIDDPTAQNIRVTSTSAKDATLPAKIQLLDDQFRELKLYPFERFVKRSADYSLTLFLTEGAGVRYLLVTPDLDWLGRTNQTTAGNRYVLLGTQPFIIGGVANGEEVRKEVPFASGGMLRIEREEDDRSIGAKRR